MLVAYQLPGMGYRYSIRRGSGLYISSMVFGDTSVVIYSKIVPRFSFYKPLNQVDAGGDERHAYEIMRFCHQLPLSAISVSLLLSSCTYEKQEVKPIATDSIVEKTDIIAVPPVREVIIKGKWKSKDNPLYPIIEFKGKSTVEIQTVLGPYVSSYERDEEFIRIRTDQSDLLFEIVSEDSIVGSGYAKGIWIKDKKD